MVELYMTVQGRSSDTHAAIDASKARLGVESSKDWIDSYTPRFVDFPFTDPDATYEDHIDVVEDVEPDLTVAPDIENDRGPEEVFRIADILLQYSRSVIVVPKSIHPTKVPDRFRVGVPTADFGSDAPWAAWDYAGTGPVHILGGGASRQLVATEHFNVASVDTATMGKTSLFGYWDGKTRDAPKEWDFRRRLKESLDNYYDALND